MNKSILEELFEVVFGLAVWAGLVFLAVKFIKWAWGA